MATSKAKPVTNLYGWTRLANAIAGKHGMKIEFVTGKDMEIDGNRVRIPMPDHKWEQKDFDNVLYMIDSYGSMWRYGADAFEDYSELPGDQPIGWMFREFEQIRTNREAAYEYRGSKRIMSDGVRNRMEDTIIPQVEGMDPKLKALMEASAEGSTHWNEGYAGAVPEIMRAVAADPEAKSSLEKLDNMYYQDKLNRLDSPAHSLTLAKEVFKELWEDDPDEQEQKERARCKGGPGKGEGGGESADGDDTGGEALEGVNPHSMGEVNDGDPSDEQGTVNYSDGNAEPPDPNGKPAYVRVTPPGNREAYFEDPSLLEHVDLKREPGYANNYGEIKSRLGHYDQSNAAIFANRLRRFLQVKSASMYTHGHRRGRVSTRNLYKMCVNETLPNEDRMFKRKHESDTLDTVVSVLVDYSGSMSGSRTVVTHIGTDLLVHALQVLNVPCEVNMFSTINEGTTMYTVKHFDEHVSADLLLDRSERAACNQANNNDSAAVMFNYDRLRRRHEKRKILLVLSDGEPCTHNVMNPQEGLKAVTQTIEADPHVELLGLGIMSDSVKHYYPHHKVVREPEEMSTALLDLVANKMIEDTHLT